MSQPKYFQLELGERREEPATAHFEEKPHIRLLGYCVYGVAFVFQMGLIWSACSPQYVPMLGSPKDGKGDSGCTAEDYTAVLAAGATFGVLLLFVILVCVGIRCGGPIAGGLFAVTMGSGLVAGSAMSVVQSAAMGGGWCGSFYGAGAVFGATLGVLWRCSNL